MQETHQLCTWMVVPLQRIQKGLLIGINFVQFHITGYKKNRLLSNLNSTSLAYNLFISFLNFLCLNVFLCNFLTFSWKKCPGDLQQNRCYMENGTSGSQILGGMHNNEYVFMQPPDASINGSINMPNFPEGRANASWCHATGWPNDPSLGPSGDRSCMEWSKSLQNQFSEVNSLFPERTWRLRTSSDNDAIANKGSQVF